MQQVKPFIGLFGILIAALAVEFNDQVISIALVDVRGGLGISNDPGTWLNSLYGTGQIIGMAHATWLALTYTPRRFALFAFTMCCVSTLLCPFVGNNLTLFYALRFLQGVAGGFIIPLLLAIGLRVLGPSVRIWGLAAYALTATFGPNIATTLAALWTDIVNWRFVFYQALPLFTAAGLMVWYGVPPEQPQLARWRKFDWTGTILIVIVAFSFVTLLEQGDRLDWFNSPLICVAALVTVVAVPLLIINELKVELPFFGLWVLGRRNFLYAFITLFIFLMYGQTASSIPTSFLQEVQGFRPLQVYPLTLIVALGALVMLPLTAVLLNFEWLDSRIVSFVGLLCLLGASLGDSYITGYWINNSLILWQSLQTIGEPLVIMPLLMMATNSLKGPQEGPFASSLVNTTRALAEPAGIWMTQLIQRWRGGFHSSRLVDQIGQTRYSTIQAQGLLLGNAPPLLPNGTPRSADSLRLLSAAVQTQTTVLTISDTFIVCGGLTVILMIVLAIVPVRTYPPRIVLAGKK